MAERKSFLLRIDADLLEALKKWADAELRSLNAQIEYILRQALRERGRLKDRPVSEAGSKAGPRRH
jgi:hypothetical protein